ncbi:putative alpha-glucoside transport [Fusarium denticulatum]|uniref:Putative alpha-glucoside transport n=1 Tax=Fusarium denticulatum TaxID=48507 RepID=A0A8H5WCK5_9HYPO|nr:putative alpha-glucoside transport [Fusarium denticulatum]
MADDKSKAADQIEVAGHTSTSDADSKQERIGFAQERDMTLWQGMKMYPWSVFWSVMVSLIIVMEGYDIVLLGGLLPQHAFAKRYGTYNEEHGWQISGPWQAALNNSTTCGTIFGALANGFLTQRFGYRKTVLSALLFINATIALQVFATSAGMLVAGNFLCGLPWGLFSVLAPAYASEICPTPLRGYLANFVCFCWAAGMLISSGVQKAFSQVDGQSAYRIPYAIQWAWPLPICCILWFAPESPWILVRRGKDAEAEAIVKRLSAKNEPVNTTAVISMMQHTIIAEQQMEDGTSYWDCFKGTNLRRTEISCMVFMCQQFGGNAINGNAVYFFTQAGVGNEIAYKLSVGSLALSCIGVVASWYLIYHWGRRTLYVFDLIVSFIALIGVGTASTVSSSTTSSYIQAGIVLVSVLIGFATIGPICYAILAEVSSVKLRSKTISIARIAYYIAQIIVNTVQTYLINPNELNLKGKSAWVWSVTCAILIVWAYFRLPETKDRMFEEIDILFAHKIPARKFSTTRVDVFDHDAVKPLEEHDTGRKSDV